MSSSSLLSRVRNSLKRSLISYIKLLYWVVYVFAVAPVSAEFSERDDGAGELLLVVSFAVCGVIEVELFSSVKVFLFSGAANLPLLLAL